jgi:carboxymethylenebutenolidase
MAYEGLVAESITIHGHNGDAIEAYLAKPMGNAPVPGVVLIHHAPGWDEWTHEAVRKLAHHGYAALSPHLYHRNGPGSPDDLAAKGRASGGNPDDQVMGDVQGAIDFLREQPYSTGKVGIIGFCSGGRQVYLAACRLSGVDAAVDCWGGSVDPADRSQLTPQRVAPIDYTDNITTPLLGIFGNDDQNPNPDEVNRIEARLKSAGKNYEFHRYDGAGHGFFAVDRAGYRPEQATDAWGKVFAFYAKYLGAPVAEPATAGD